MKRSRRNRLLSVLTLDRGAWRHPWHVWPAWSQERERWEASIKPGLVNALDPVVTLPWDEAPQETRDRIERLGGEPTGSVDAWLTESPRLPLSTWRAIGGAAGPSGGTITGGFTYEGVPEFFSARGVRKAARLTLEGDIVTQEVQGLLTATETERHLRACELVLHLDRTATRTEWTTGSGLDGTFAQFEVTAFERPGRRERGYIRAMSTWEPRVPGTMQDALRGGGWEDSPTDEVHLATVYVLSPPGPEHGTSEVDETWQPFVRHHLWWNLHHGTNRLATPPGRTDLRLLTGLAGGVGDTTNQLILAQVNDANSNAATFLKQQKVESRRWSA